MGSPEQLARLAGVVAGLALAFAAAFPFTGVPPRGGSQVLAPASIKLSAAVSGEFEIDPVGPLLKAAPLPPPGVKKGAPLAQVTVRNITALPLQLSIRLNPIASGLGDVALIRASGAGAVLVNGALSTTDDWTPPAGCLPSGATTTVRLKFSLKPGLAPDQWRGRLDVRELEFKAVPTQARAGDEPTQLTTTPSTPPSTLATTPTTTP